LEENLVVTVDSGLDGRGRGAIGVRRSISVRGVVFGRVENALEHCSGGVFSGCERDAAASVAVQGEPADHERVTEQVEGLALVAAAVGAAEPEGVVEVAVD
jgi:hypothetical protein